MPLPALCQEYPLLFVSCPHCPKKFKSVKKLWNHAVGKHNIGKGTSLFEEHTREHCCALCGVSFPGLCDDLAAHLAKSHENWPLSTYLQEFYDHIEREDEQEKARKRRSCDAAEEPLPKRVKTEAGSACHEESLDAMLALWRCEDLPRFSEMNDFFCCPHCSLTSVDVSFPSMESVQRHIEKQHFVGRTLMARRPQETNSDESSHRPSSQSAFVSAA